MNRYIIDILKCRDDTLPKKRYFKYIIYKNGSCVTPRKSTSNSMYYAIGKAISYIETKNNNVINFNLYIFNNWICEITMERPSFCKVRAKLKTLGPAEDQITRKTKTK